MTLTKAKLAELRRIRDGATQGEWKWERQDWDNGDTSYEFQDTGRLIALRQSNYDQPMRAKFDAEYIAAFDPPTTCELLDRLESAEKALRFYAHEDAWSATKLYPRTRERPGHLFIGTRIEKYHVMGNRMREEDSGKTARAHFAAYPDALEDEP